MVHNLSYLLYCKGSNPSDKKIIFADDTASGRPCWIVDRLIEKNVYPYYSNTHSNAYCGMRMKEEIEKVRQIITKHFTLDADKCILFTGNGTTACVNHLLSRIDCSHATIYLTDYEHHSNFLPWITKTTNVKMVTHEQLLTEKFVGPSIISITACSNVTGRIFMKEIRKIWQRVKNNQLIYLFIDCATCAPYIEIDGSMCTAMFFSGHKFLGGPGSPGCLIVDKKLLQNPIPYMQGGGCVITANTDVVRYKTDAEARESCGTPNITGIIRLGYAILLKTALFNEICGNERYIKKLCMLKFKQLLVKYETLKLIENKRRSDLPIYSVVIQNLHYNLVVRLFSDLMGIQTRGGVSCCGNLSKKSGVDGWVRITFSYLLTKLEIKKIFETLEYIVVHGHEYIGKYEYNPVTNLWM